MMRTTQQLNFVVCTFLYFISHRDTVDPSCNERSRYNVREDKVMSLLDTNETVRNSGELTVEAATESEWDAWEPSYLSDPFGSREPISEGLGNSGYDETRLFGRCLHRFQRATAARFPICVLIYFTIADRS